MITKRRFKSQIGTTLLMLMISGLIISTFHSHHHIKWNHLKHSADTGSTISTDASLCPICGYLLKINLSAAPQSVDAFFHVEEFITQSDDSANYIRFAVPRGRAPPSTA